MRLEPPSARWVALWTRSALGSWATVQRTKPVRPSPRVPAAHARRARPRAAYSVAPWRLPNMRWPSRSPAVRLAPCAGRRRPSPPWNLPSHLCHRCASRLRSLPLCGSAHPDHGGQTRRQGARLRRRCFCRHGRQPDRCGVAWERLVGLVLGDGVGQGGGMRHRRALERRRPLGRRRLRRREERFHRYVAQLSRALDATTTETPALIALHWGARRRTPHPARRTGPPAASSACARPASHRRRRRRRERRDHWRRQLCRHGVHGAQG